MARSYNVTKSSNPCLDLILVKRKIHPFFHNIYPMIFLAQKAEATEYTDCNSAEVLDSPDECPGIDTKQSHRGALVMLEI